MPFVMEVSNYTTRIISQNYNLYFVKKEQANRVFAGYAKIKSDLKDKVLPEIDMSRNRYYDTCFKGEGFYSDLVHNIDIKNAYPSILFNAGYIRKETFDYLNKMAKQDKLAALGMLASRKDIFSYSRSGAIIKTEERISPLSNFFFYCVQQTEFIIQSCKTQIFQDYFLFSWVDGIYYLNDNPELQQVCQWYLKEKFNLDSTFQKLTNFEVILKKDSYKIKFLDEKERNKVFNIPLPETELKLKIINYLLTKKYDK